ncbi:MAG: Fic family protein [FCB group bacterium]|nr:Fic family protein [FCB group bacterium]
MQLGGALETVLIENQTVRQRFITRGIMEEAIASSQLEGANTTRKFAKRMLLEKRKPSNRFEQMILNNYQAMLHVEQSLCNEELTSDLLLDLHVRLTRDTIDSKDVGRIRNDNDQVVVCDAISGMVYHIPPPSKILKVELKRFIQYANDDSPKSQFVHPLIKAILLHFWVGYLHPFTDGNGRLARTIFYWYLLRKKYWAFSYLPVSKAIRNSPGQYRDAYIYSEQDGNDLTYFIDYNIRKITQAKREFEAYVKYKEIENRKMAEVAREKYRFNERQIQLLRYLHKNPKATTSIKTHSQIYSISRVTARKDLEGLEEMGFLTSQRFGRERPFTGTIKTSELFSK